MLSHTTAAWWQGLIEHPTPFPSSDHVWTITGLAVDPALERQNLHW